jgi:hypothetical protein
MGKLVSVVASVVLAGMASAGCFPVDSESEPIYQPSDPDDEPVPDDEPTPDSPTPDSPPLGSPTPCSPTPANLLCNGHFSEWIPFVHVPRDGEVDSYQDFLSTGLFPSHWWTFSWLTNTPQDPVIVGPEEGSSAFAIETGEYLGGYYNFSLSLGQQIAHLPTGSYSGEFVLDGDTGGTTIWFCPLIYRRCDSGAYELVQPDCHVGAVSGETAHAFEFATAELGCSDAETVFYMGFEPSWSPAESAAAQRVVIRSATLVAE